MSYYWFNRLNYCKKQKINTIIGVVKKRLLNLENKDVIKEK